MRKYSTTAVHRLTAVTLGPDTFSDVLTDGHGRSVSYAGTIGGLVGHAVLADRAGVGFCGIGEHHTTGMPLWAPDVVLAAIAARALRIRLGSVVTGSAPTTPSGCSSAVRSSTRCRNGRAEVILGRGSSMEWFPLFGYDRAGYRPPPRSGPAERRVLRHPGSRRSCANSSAPEKKRNN
jgi:hypothetical protein